MRKDKRLKLGSIFVFFMNKVDKINGRKERNRKDVII